jgi:intein/homing endonuclease
LHVGGQVIRTTPEHPFWVQGEGWLPAGQLRVGDLLVGHDGRWVEVEDVLDTGEYETVYNLRIADYHTYFVGTPEWGFSVWAHNQSCAGVLKPLKYTDEEIAAFAKAAQTGNFAEATGVLFYHRKSSGTSPSANQASLAWDLALKQGRTQARQAGWAGDMEQVNGTMARLARRALREGGGDWRQAEAALARYAEAMNNRFERVGSSKRAVVDAAVENGSGLRNGGYGTRTEPWNADGSPRAGTSRIELAIESTALPGRPVVSAVDISYNYRKVFEWAKYTDAFGPNVPIADIRMSRNLWNRSDPILNYVEWRQGGSVISRQDFGRQGLPAGW